MHKLTSWLTFFIALFVFQMRPLQINGQDSMRVLSLNKAYQMARENYPLIKQKELLQKTSFLTLENMNTAYLPQFSLNGQASYQSDVTSVSIPLPGFHITALSKDQYKFWGELNQLIYDGGMVKNQKEIQEKSALMDDQKLEVELYKLKDRISQLYLGVLLMDAQYMQAKLLKENMQLGLNTVNAQLANGTVFKSASLVLQAQLLQTEQRIVEIKASKSSILRVLELFIHQKISDQVVLEQPVVLEILDDSIQRPEIKLYAYQDSFWHTQNQLIAAKSNPKLSLFAQAGYGKPGLNMLQNDFAWYGIGGLRLNWSLSNLYTNKREHQIVGLNQKINDVQKDLFLFNTSTLLSQQQTEIKKLKEIVRIDEQIISVRENITEASKAQLQNGVINSNDYLREVNAEDQTKSNFILHQIQLLQAKINYQNIKGNQ